MNLDAIHDGEVLVGRSAAHGQARTELLGGGHSGQGLERPEDVVDRAGDLEDLLGPDRDGGGGGIVLLNPEHFHDLLTAHLWIEEQNHGRKRFDLRDVAYDRRLTGSGEGQAVRRRPLSDRELPERIGGDGLVAQANLDAG